MKFYRWRIGVLHVDLIEAGDSIVRLLRSGCDFERDTLLTWIKLCGIDGTVVDVGCYTGVFSILAAKLGRDVIAFEPMRENHERCRENFILNGVVVDLRYACAADRDGPIELKFNPKVPGLTSGASLIRPSGGRESAPHPSQGVTIDSLGLDDCTAIKIDVERGEPIVLKGAQQTLERCCPALLVEVLGAAEGKAIREAVPGYQVAAVLDQRNWLMLPK